MEAQQAEWVYSTEEYPKNLWMSYEYASTACQRTGARINMEGCEFKYHVEHPNEVIKVKLGDLMPYLDDYVMSMHDPVVEDFAWSMDDDWHIESFSQKVTETDIPQLMLFAEWEAILAKTACPSEVPLAGRDSSRAAHCSWRVTPRSLAFFSASSRTTAMNPIVTCEPGDAFWAARTVSNSAVLM